MPNGVSTLISREASELQVCLRLAPVGGLHAQLDCLHRPTQPASRILHWLQRSVLFHLPSATAEIGLRVLMLSGWLIRCLRHVATRRSTVLERQVAPRSSTPSSSRRRYCSRSSSRQCSCLVVLLSFCPSLAQGSRTARLVQRMTARLSGG